MARRCERVRADRVDLFRLPVVTPPVDREQFRRDLSDALGAIQRDYDVAGLDALAATLTTMEEMPYAFHGRLLQKNLAAVPRNYNALIWSLVQVVSTLEREPS